MGSQALRPLGLRAGALVAAGAAGAGIAVGVVVLLGGLVRDTMTVREVVNGSPPGSGDPSFARAARPLTIQEIYVRAAPGVVQVTAAGGSGSGFVIDKAGHVVTNDRVVKGATSAEVSFSNDERLPARIVGRDPSTDLAVLQVQAQARALTPLPLGDPGSLQVGDAVVAIGNPLGKGRSVTAGIVSALRRRALAADGASIDRAIETDATLGSGDTGGPLLDSGGRVVGVTTEVRGAGGAAFAIPVDTVENVAAQLIAHGVAAHPFLGVDASAITPSVARLFRLPVQHGLLVGSVCGGSGAALAGLRGAAQEVTLAGDTWPLGGDIIVQADGVAVTSAAQLDSLVQQRLPGDTLRLEIYRGTKDMTLEVTLGRQPLSPRC